MSVFEKKAEFYIRTLLRVNKTLAETGANIEKGWKDIPFCFETAKAICYPIIQAPIKDTEDWFKTEKEFDSIVTVKLEQILAEMNKVAEYETRIADLTQEVARLRSERLLWEELGEYDFKKLMEEGSIKVKGSNGAIYEVTKNCSIRKNPMLDGTEEWKGQISGAGGYNMGDVLVSVLKHIKNRADQFDNEKGCGEISIKGLNDP